MTRLAVAAAVTAACLTGCSHSPSGPTLPVQKLCGRVVSVEVGLIEQDATRLTTLRLATGRPNLIVFDRTCRGVAVDPAPRTVLQVVNPPYGDVAEVHGPDGVIGGTYVRARRGTVRLKVTPQGRPGYTVTLRFHRAVWVPLFL